MTPNGGLRVVDDHVIEIESAAAYRGAGEITARSLRTHPPFEPGQAHQFVDVRPSVAQPAAVNKCSHLCPQRMGRRRHALPITTSSKQQRLCGGGLEAGGLPPPPQRTLLPNAPHHGPSPHRRRSQSRPGSTRHRPHATALTAHSFPCRALLRVAANPPRVRDARANRGLDRPHLVPDPSAGSAVPPLRAANRTEPRGLGVRRSAHAAPSLIRLRGFVCQPRIAHARPPEAQSRKKGLSYIKNARDVQIEQT